MDSRAIASRTDAPPQDTLTSKAQRVASVASELLSVLTNVRRSASAAAEVPVKLGPPSPPPAPDHIVFALEQAEQDLSTALDIAREVHRLL